MRRALLLVMVLVVAAAACADPSGGRVVQQSSDGRFEQVAVEDVEIWRSVQGSGGGLDAEVAGTVGYDEDCGAFLHSAEFDLRYPVVWPAGTEIERADPLSIRLPGGSTAELGEAVSGGGGYHSDVALFGEGCAESGETAIFNASGDVEVATVAPDTTEQATPAAVTFDRCADLAGLAAGPGGEGWPLGYPHNAEEFEAIMARNGDPDQLGELQQWAASTHPNTWGGLWLAELVDPAMVCLLPGGNECPGNPVTSFILELDEPLSGRQLLDGAGGIASEPSLDR